MLEKSSDELCAVARSGFGIGGVHVQISGERESDVTLLPPLEPFRVAEGAFDIRIQVEWVASIPEPRWRPLFDSGTTWRLYESGSRLGFDFSSEMLGPTPYRRLLIDEAFNTATIQMSEECFRRLPYAADSLGYPLDELLIMHRLTQEKGIELHGCGIVRGDGVGNLFVGHSGAGKSTTTRLWTEREEVEVLSDDRIIVRRDEGGSAVKTPSGATGGANEQQVLRLRDSSASRTSHFAQDDKIKKTCGMRMYGTPWHGEAMYASPGSAPLARIFVLEHGRGNVVTRLSPSQAVGELFARSFVPFHRHEYVESALEFLHELVGTLPVYHYAFEPTEAAVERILEFCD
jgi:hypothetical protein